MGYSERYKAWRLFDTSTNKDSYSSEVLFEEELKVQSQQPDQMPLLEQVYPTQLVETEISLPMNVNNTPDGVAPVEPDTAKKNDYNSDSSDDPLTSANNEINLICTSLMAVKSFPDTSIQTNNLYTALLTHISTEDSPTYLEAMDGPYKQQFIEAIQKEFNSLASNKVLSKPCYLPDGFQALDTKMVLKLKEAENSVQERRAKARLCGKGFKQIYGIDYFMTFSPVATYDSLRIFVTIMASLDYELDVVDVITAFLLAPLKEEIYIKIPDGYPNAMDLRKSGKVLRLLKSLYGLKQAPRDWNQELNSYLIELGFRPLDSEKCIYVGRFGDKGDVTVYLLVYVDDVILATPSRPLMKSLKAKIHLKFPITDKGPISFYLNMHFIRDRKSRTIQIHQQPKIEKLLLDPRLSAEDLAFISKPSKTPASDDEVLSKDQCPTEDIEIKKMESLDYKSFVGILLYIAITSRPDIATAVSSVARFSHNPGMIHWKAVLRILKYLQGTKRYKLLLGGRNESTVVASKYSKVLAYADADYASDIDGRRSRTGFAIYLYGSLVIWSSKLQQSVSLSSTEAEYIALTSTTRMVIWVRALMSEMGFPQTQPSIIYEDNKSCINIAESYKTHPAVKHIDVRHHFIRDRVLEVKDIQLQKLGTADMTADLFTKQLPYPSFKKHRRNLGITNE